MASALGCAALSLATAAQATIILQAQPGPGPAETVRVDLVSLHGFADVLGLDATLTFAPPGLTLLGVQYPASFSPAATPARFPPSGASGAALATPGYLFTTGAVNVDPGELFSWLFEVPSGTPGPFAFAVDLLVWPPVEDVPPVELSARTSFAAVPEPGTWPLLAAAGLSWLLLPRRRSLSGPGDRARILAIAREAGHRIGRA